PDINEVAGKSLRTVGSIGVEDDLAAALETLASKVRFLRQEQRLDRLVDMGGNRIEGNDAGLGDIGLDTAADLDAVALPARHQKLGAIALHRKQFVFVSKRGALPL